MILKISYDIYKILSLESLVVILELSTFNELFL